MKRLIFVIVGIVVVVFAIGLLMGWFHVATRSADGKSDITLTVDQDKIQLDKNKATARLQDLGQQATDKAVAATQSAQDQNSASVQTPQTEE